MGTWPEALPGSSPSIMKAHPAACRRVDAGSRLAKPRMVRATAYLPSGLVRSRPRFHSSQSVSLLGFVVWT